MWQLLSFSIDTEQQLEKRREEKRPKFKRLRLSDATQMILERQNTDNGDEDSESCEKKKKKKTETAVAKEKAKQVKFWYIWFYDISI